jgi:hypothetical protein
MDWFEIALSSVDLPTPFSPAPVERGGEVETTQVQHETARLRQRNQAQNSGPSIAFGGGIVGLH